MALAPNSVNVPDLREGGAAHATVLAGGKHHPVGVLALSDGTLVDGANPLPVTGSFTANIEGDYQEDSPHVSGDRGLFMLAVYSTASGPSSQVDTSGDYSPLLLSPAGELWVKQDGLSFGAPADGVANPTTAQRVTSYGEVWNGTTWDRMKGSTADGVLVNLGTNNDVTVTLTPTASTIPAQGSVNGNALTTTYQTVLAPGGTYAILQIWDSCDTAISISLDGGTTTHYVLERGERTITVDFAANGKLGPNSNIQAKHNGSVPTTGTVRATVTR